MGTESRGLYVYDMGADTIRKAEIPTVSEDFSRWKVHALLEDNQGNIWAGAYQTGVLVIPRSMYGFELIRADYGCVSSVARDSRDGTLWVGTDGGGILRVERNGRRTFFTAEN
ncbi:MAG: hypothetical protein J6P56_05570, partial [Bacteroidales bacterium]|nr:hypothetical protein [Bacteroidales bacterium]